MRATPAGSVGPPADATTAGGGAAEPDDAESVDATGAVAAAVAAVGLPDDGAVAAAVAAMSPQLATTTRPPGQGGRGRQRGAPKVTTQAADSGVGTLPG